MASTTPTRPDNLRTIDQIVREFIGLKPTRRYGERSTESNTLHTGTDSNGIVWWCNGPWMAQASAFPALVQLCKKFPVLSHAGRFEFQYEKGAWKCYSTGEVNPTLRGFIDSALRNASTTGAEAKRAYKALGSGPALDYLVELQYKDNRLWPMMVDKDGKLIDRYLPAGYAEALQSSAPANYVNYRSHLVQYQGWLAPVEVAGSGQFVFPHWHTLAITENMAMGPEPIHVSPQARIIDSFLCEVRV